MQQKVVLARWLLLGPKLLILDEPTRGVDIATRSGVYALLRAVAERGVGILLISSDFEEVLGLADRVVVIADGADVTNIPAAILDVEKLAMFAAPRSSAEGTHRVLTTLVKRFGGTAFWVYVERERAYCFDRVGSGEGGEPGFGRGGFPLIEQTAIAEALALRREDAFTVDAASGCATLILPLPGYAGHHHGSIGITLPAWAPRPESAAVGRVVEAALSDRRQPAAAG
jgi:ribose transport system ATP-binding protein/rhamnose transport system ATP-binding protein